MNTQNWRHTWRKRPKKKAKLFSKDNINLITAVGSFLTAIVAILLTVTDRSQQKQIDQLTNILGEVKKENSESKNQTQNLIKIVSRQDSQIYKINEQIGISNNQNERLLQIASNTKNQDSLTRGVLIGIRDQLYGGSKAERTQTILAYGELQDLTHKIYDLSHIIALIDSNIVVKKYSHSDIQSILNQIKNLLDNGTKNTFLVNNIRAYVQWLNFRSMTGIVLDYFSTQWDPSVKITVNGITQSDSYMVSIFQNSYRTFSKYCMNLSPVFPNFKLTESDKKMYGIDTSLH